MTKPRKSIIAFSIFTLGVALIPFIHYLRNVAADFNYPPLAQTVRFPALAIFGFLYIGYWMYLKTQRERFEDKSYSLRTVLWLGLFIGAYLCAVYPVFSVDLYEYVMRGRIFSVYHANPYLHPPSEFPKDLFYRFIFWKDQPMLYGPVAVHLISSIAGIARESIFFSLFSVKFLLLIFHLLITFFIYRIAKEAEYKEPLFISQMYLFNPFVLIMTLVDGHFDAIMMVFLISSIFMLYKKKFYLSWFLLGLSFLAKYLTVILAPFYLIYMYSNIEKKSEFFKKISVSFFIVLLTVIAAYKPLWAGFGIFYTFKIVGTGFDSNTFPFIFYKCLSLIMPNLSVNAFRYFSYSIFGAIYLCTLAFYLKTKDKRQGLLTSVLILFSSYILFASFQLGAWYIVWIIPFILLSRIPYRFLLVGLVSFAALISFWKRISFLLIGAIFLYIITIRFERIRHVQSSGQK